MSEQSIEYNLGTLGYGDAVDLGLLAYQDGRAYFTLVFSNPKDKRSKPVVLLMTDYTFSEFSNLLLEAEVQINKLLTTNKISGLALPEILDIHFRSNLGSVDYDTRELTVSIIVMKERTGILQLLARETKGRSSGFSVVFDDSEFTKLKSIVDESSKTVIKPQPQVQNIQSNAEVRDIKFITFTANGDLSPLDVRNYGEAHLALKEIPLIKKELLENKRKIEEQIRRIRADYTDEQRRKSPKLFGGGWFGKFVRNYQTLDQHNQKFKLASDLEPLEKRKRYFEDLISKLHQYALDLDKIMSGRKTF